MKNYTTTIQAHKSKAEIELLLARNGAGKIMTEYDSKGNPITLKFCLVHQGKELCYSLPCRVDGIHSFLQAKKEAKFKTWNHALNVGWRILKDWVEIQISLIESEMADIEEVFLPYLLVASDATLYDRFIDDSQKLLNS